MVTPVTRLMASLEVASGERLICSALMASPMVAAFLRSASTAASVERLRCAVTTTSSLAFSSTGSASATSTVTARPSETATPWMTFAV
jgi:hypothetical protein